MTWDGWGPGTSSPKVAAVKAAIKRRFSYGETLSEGPDYRVSDEAPIVEFQQRVHAEVISGLRSPPDPRTDGRIDWATQVQLGVIQRAPAPPLPPKDRHLAVVYRGIGGIIGSDYVSRVCQAAVDLVEEVNPSWAATMGEIPVGAAGNPGDPSMQTAVELALSEGQRIIIDALRSSPRRRVIIGGYSGGAVVAARLRQWLLANFPDNYLCSFSFGDPTRPAGGCYFGGVPAPGRGISTWRYGDVHDWRHCWLAAPGDMYTSVPDGPAGDIMDTVYEMVTRVELSDPLATAQAIIPRIPVILEEAGIDLPAIFGVLTGQLPVPSAPASTAGALGAASTGIAGALGGVVGGPAGAGIAAALTGSATAVAAVGIPIVISGLRGVIGTVVGGTNANLSGPAAAAQAAIIGLQFIASQPPTAPHIQYEFREVWPGQTYLGLAIQHVRDYSSRFVPASLAGA
ncbi:hypothetical protein [Mycobacterium sp.]|uniref:hypothetical protein n=1 Tax=Mycobacterium sp. TaxID=1785 RepID=UPI003BAA5111